MAAGGVDATNRVRGALATARDDRQLCATPR
jgi:hypothetical protein